MNLGQNEIFSNPQYAILYLIATIWVVGWKGLALWRAGKLGQRNWFVAILVISSLGILEIVYLFKFAKKPLSVNEIKSWFGR